MKTQKLFKKMKTDILVDIKLIVAKICLSVNYIYLQFRGRKLLSVIINKEFLQINKRQPPNKKWTTDIRKQFTEEHIRVTDFF